jgi:anti-sigma B factor antagonist
MGSVDLSLNGFSLNVEPRNGVVRIAPRGELDLASAPALADSLQGAEQDGTDAIMLDLEELTFIDCTGLHVLLKASERANANGHRLVIVGASSAARRLFALTGTEFLIEQESVGVLDRFTAADGRRSSGTAV